MAFVHDPSKPILAKLLRLHILHRLLFMSTKTDKKPNVAQRGYKQYFYRAVRNLRMFCSGYTYKSISRQRLKTASNTIVEKRQSKLLPK